PGNGYLGKHHRTGYRFFEQQERTRRRQHSTPIIPGTTNSKYMDTITVQQLKERLDNGEQLNVIDCREPAEYEEYNIGAALIPLGNIQNGALGPLEGKEEEEIIIHCRSGKRSAAACQYLE